MTPKRFFYAMLSINLGLIMLIGGTVYFGTEVISKKSNQLVAAKTETKVAEEKQVLLTQAKVDIAKYAELNSIAKSIVPQDKDQARTVREINKIASETGVPLKGIAFQSSSLGQAAAPTAASGTASQTQQNTPNGTSNPAATTTPAPASPSLTQVKPVEGISGVYALEIVVSSLETQPVSYNSLINFLEKLETNRRTAHVAKINIKPSPDGNSLSFVLTLNAYVKP